MGHAGQKAKGVLIHENKHARCREPPPSFITRQLFAHLTNKTLGSGRDQCHKVSEAFSGITHNTTAKPQRKVQAHRHRATNQQTNAGVKKRCHHYEPVSDQRSSDRVLPLPICRKGKQRLTEHTVLTGPQPEPFSLFMHTAVCLLKQKGQLSSSPERKQKSQRALTRTDRGLSDKMDALEIKGDKHNVVYI